MKKIIQYFIIGVLGVSFLTSCKKNAPTATSLTSVGENTNTGSVDAGTISREIYVSGIPGKIHEVRVRIIGSTSYTHELEVYLKSPSGEILTLYFSDDGYFNANDAHFSSWELFLSTDN